MKNRNNSNLQSGNYIDYHDYNTYDSGRVNAIPASGSDSNYAVYHSFDSPDDNIAELPVDNKDNVTVQSEKSKLVYDENPEYTAEKKEHAAEITYFTGAALESLGGFLGGIKYTETKKDGTKVERSSDLAVALKAAGVAMQFFGCFSAMKQEYDADRGHKAEKGAFLPALALATAGTAIGVALLCTGAVPALVSGVICGISASVLITTIIVHEVNTMSWCEKESSRKNDMDSVVSQQYMEPSAPAL